MVADHQSGQYQGRLEIKTDTLGGKPQGKNTMKRTGSVGALVAVMALAASAVVALADDYPSHPIIMMVGFPPGGPTDTLARILGEAMKKTLGQTIVIDDVTGAGGTIATGPRRSCSPGRLYDRHRQLVESRRFAGALRARLRHFERPAADLAANGLATLDSRQK